MAPKKSKYIRGNEKPHMNKGLKKAIMKRTRLLNSYRKSKSSSDWEAYRAQRNLVTKLNRRTRVTYFDRAIKCSERNSKTFWNSCKPFLSNKGAVTRDINLSQNGSPVQEDVEIAKLFNVHFNQITNSLNLRDWDPIYESVTITDPTLRSIDKFKSHPSILAIKSNTGPLESFSFREVTSEEVDKLIKSLNCTKKVGGPIPTKILKLSQNVVSPLIKNCINFCLKSCKFPSSLKLAEITPIPKAEESNSTSDYRPISILPLLSKIFEKVIANQLSEYFESKFSKFLCGFRKHYSCQLALINLLKSWQKDLDEGRIVGTVLIVLFKAYDCLPHDLLIAKLAAYGINFASLKLLHDYLSKRFHRVKIGSICSDWRELLSGVPQGSILGPLLFNIFLNDFVMFIKETELCNFADDNSLYASSYSLDELKSILERETSNALHWFLTNSMAANPAKFQIMFLGVGNEENVCLNLNGVTLTSTPYVKLLGVYIDSKLDFKKHVQTLCKSASQKTNALLRIRPYLNTDCAKLLCSAYILSSFNYCPLIWMFGCKSNNGLINKIHKRALRAVYRDFEAPLEVLLEKGKSVSIHVQNLRSLMVEIFKSLNRISPEIMWDMFEPKPTSYNLRSGNTVKLPKAKSSKFGINSLIFRGSITWNSLPSSLKSTESLNTFKREIKLWDGKNCTCYICQKP